MLSKVNYNRQLQLFDRSLAGLSAQFKNRVKELMGWKSDNRFYDCVRGRKPCTPAEQIAFKQAAAALKIESLISVFTSEPETEAATQANDQK